MTGFYFVSPPSTGGGGGGGPVSMGGDCSQTSDLCKVVGLQGRSVSAAAPTSGQFLGWNNTTSVWEPKALPAVTFAGVTSALGPGAPATALQLLVSSGVGAFAYLAAPGTDGHVLTRTSGTAIGWAAPAAPTEAQLRTAALALTAPLAVPPAAAPTADGHLVRLVDVMTLLSSTQVVTIAAGTAARTLTATECSGGSILFAGTYTVDLIVTFPTVAAMPSIAGRSFWITAPALGGVTMRCNGGNGGSTYMLPGETRRITIDNAGRLRTEGGYAWECPLEISLIGTDFVRICKLPPGAALGRAEALITEAITTVTAGGVIKWAVSTANSTNDAYTIIKGDSYAMSALGMRRGRASTDWGPTLFSTGRWDDAGDATIFWVRDTNTTQYATGKLQMLLQGHWLAP